MKTACTLFCVNAACLCIRHVFDKAIVYFETKKINHIHYVGLSRVGKLSRVFLTEMNAGKIHVSPDVEIEMERLRNHRKITHLIPCLDSFDSMLYTKISFNNCRSLRKHFVNFRQETYMLYSDILYLVETRFWNLINEKYSLEGFNRFCDTLEQTARGIAMFVNK